MDLQTKPTPTTTRNLSIIAGIGYLVIFLSGIFANFFIIEPIFQQGTAKAIYQEVQDQSFMFRFGILSFIIMVVFDLLLTWALYLLFTPVHAHLSLLAGLFRLVNTAIFGVAVFHLLDISSHIQSTEVAGVFGPDQTATEIVQSYQAFNHTWLIGLVFFGIHLAMLGYLIIRTRHAPGWIGIALMIAAAGYLVDSFAQFMLPAYPEYKDVFMAIVVIPGVIGELSLTFWLLFKGGRTGPLTPKQPAGIVPA